MDEKKTDENGVVDDVKDTVPLRNAGSRAVREGGVGNTGTGDPLARTTEEVA